MIRQLPTPLITAVLVSLVTASVARPQPPPVPRLTERPLDHASYVELAQQWKQFIEKTGETADALVNLGRAYVYTEELDAAVAAGRRAVELEPDDPRALEFMGQMLATYVGDREEAIRLLKRCRKLAPEYGYGLTTLASTHLFRGELAEAEEVFEVIFQQRIVPRPLQDYAYNMLVGLPPGAVLITGGDNDTFGPLALQAGMDFRTDVVVLNRSLLNVPEYVEAVFQRHPAIRPDYDIASHETVMKDGVPQLLSHALIQAMVRDRKAPVYLAASADTQGPEIAPEMHIEGINLRAGGGGLSAEESARLFRDVYRLDSATDWNFAWSLTPAVAGLLRNYVSAMIKLAGQKGISKDTRMRLLDSASTVATFHDLTELTRYIEALKKK